MRHCVMQGRRQADGSGHQETPTGASRTSTTTTSPSSFRAADGGWHALILSWSRRAVAASGWILLLVLAMPSGPAQADTLGDAFRAARRTVAPMASRARLEIVHDTTITSAMAARFEDGVCRIFVLENAAYLTDSLGQLPPALRAPYLEALFAHEFGHCQEQYLISMDAGARETPSPALVPVRMHRNADGGLLLISIRREALWGEILADAYFGMYLNERHPALSRRLIDFHLAQRGSAALVDPEHDTARFLAGLPLQRQHGEFMHEAGQRLRRTATGVDRVALNGAGQ